MGNVCWAVVRFQKEGYHCWPDAPEEVAFLRNLHRHIFHIEVKIQQHHNDRDVEYFIFKNQCKLWMEDFIWEDRTSCEDIASYLHDKASSLYHGVRKVKVSVFEDGENGCEIE